MELKFLGRGAAFNPKEGNNSAYFIENKELFLLDCGEGIFERIIKNNTLNDIDKVNILITHTHSDHVGSIGSLIMYCFYIKKIKTNIILPADELFKNNLEQLLTIFGCSTDMYNAINDEKYTNKYTEFSKIQYKRTNHTNNLPCYSIIFYTKNGIVYYSGDTKDIKNLEEIIKNNQKIDKIYVDTTSLDYEGNVHLYIGELYKKIPDNLKDKVYCMHLNDDNCIYQAEILGFNVVENIDQIQKAKKNIH